MLGPFGEVVPTRKSGSPLLVQDTVGTLRRVKKVIEAAEKKAAGPGGGITHKCEYVAASAVERQLKEIVSAGRPAGSSAVAVVSNDSLRAVYVSGPQDQLDRAARLLRMLDKPAMSGVRVIAKRAFLKRHNVPAGTADAFAQHLRVMFPKARITTIGNNVVMVYALPAEQMRIAEIIASVEDNEGVPRTAIISVGDLDPEKIATWVERSLSTGVGPAVEALPEKKAIAVRGTPEQIKEAREIVKELLDNARAPKGKSRER
jgi:type II secretory pathway component GspD/PulD (secretin)